MSSKTVDEFVSNRRPRSLPLYKISLSFPGSLPLEFIKTSLFSYLESSAGELPQLYEVSEKQIVNVSVEYLASGNSGHSLLELHLEMLGPGPEVPGPEVIYRVPFNPFMPDKSKAKSTLLSSLFFDMLAKSHRAGYARTFYTVTIRPYRILIIDDLHALELTAIIQERPQRALKNFKLIEDSDYPLLR